MPNQVAYGFVRLQDLFDRRVQDVQISVIEDALRITLEEHNRQLDALYDLFVERTTEFQERFRTPTVARLQPFTQDGRALPIKVAGQYDIAYPIQGGGLAWGNNFMAGVEMTVGEVNEITNTMVMADIRWMRDHLMASLFTNVNWTFPDEKHGNLVVKPLANGDGTNYLIKTGHDAGADDTHFIAQTAVIATATDPIPNMARELREHPENGDTVIILVPSANKEDVEGLAAFMDLPDSVVALGANSDRLVQTLGQAVPGELFGYHRTAKAWLVEWASQPDNYLIGVTIGGAKAIAMRERENARLRGFVLVGERNDYPFFQRQWMRLAGFGARNRVGAVVQQVEGGDTTYDIPAVNGVSYEAPIM